MRHGSAARWAGVALAVVFLTGLPAVTFANTPLEVVWRDSLRMRGTSDHGDIEIRLGGRVHFDAVFGMADFDLDDDPSPNAFKPRDGYRIRRARFDLRGVFFSATSFKLQLDFAGGSVSFADAFLRFNAGPGGLIVGQSKAPMSVADMTSSNSWLTMERSFVAQIFAPGRHLGVAYQGNVSDNLLGLHLGFYRNSTGAGVTPNPNLWLLSGRVWASLMNDNDNADLHVGVSFNHWFLNGTSQVFRTRPVVNLEPGSRPLSRSIPDLDGNTILGLEAVFTTGRLRAILDVGSVITSPGDDDPDAESAFLWAVSATLGYLLNGGKARYSASGGSMSNPSVAEPFGSGGIGLFEAVLHFDYGDLTDGADDGADDGAGLSAFQVALGINWYVNNNVRILWNFGLMNVDGDGNYLMTGIRFQFAI